MKSSQQYQSSIPFCLHCSQLKLKKENAYLDTHLKNYVELLKKSFNKEMSLHNT